jgi:aarF domain-containing kinase
MLQAKRFASAHSHLPYIDTVDIIPQLSSQKVLTSKWIVGASPNDLLNQVEALPHGSLEHAALKARLVHMVNLGVECSLSQLLETGVMHADPHPGNLILTPKDRLAYLDFGLLTFVPPQSSQVPLLCASRCCDCLRCLCSVPWHHNLIC